MTVLSPAVAAVCVIGLDAGNSCVALGKATTIPSRSSPAFVNESAAGNAASLRAARWRTLGRPEGRDAGVVLAMSTPP
jgi:hypothetical protein